VGPSSIDVALNEHRMHWWCFNSLERVTLLLRGFRDLHYLHQQDNILFATQSSEDYSRSNSSRRGTHDTMGSARPE